jgi:hypothetical protein
VCWSWGMADGSFCRCRSRARWVGCGRLVEGDEDRLLGTGMVEVSGEMEAVEAGAILVIGSV